MRMIRLAVPFLLALVVLPTFSRVEAQGLGGMIKKKAGEVAKGKGSKAEPAKKEDDGPIKSTLGCDVTPDAVSRFERGLKAERQQVSDFESMFSGLRSHEQVIKCRQDEAISPTVQQILSQGITQNATNAQLQAAMAKNMVDVEAHMVKKCGEDPSKYNPREQRELARKAGAKAAGMTDECYDKLKEFALSFCKLPPETRKAAVENGIRVPGKGSGVWVFTADEAKALDPRCDQLVPAIEATGYKPG